jgi:hypothetical protein
MAEHGIHDFLVAKRKAADRFGVTDQSALPRNTEIEEALAGYQRLFGGAAHEANLRELRLTALKAMRLLGTFEPRLVGPVLTGMATRHDDVQIHVFSDRPEEPALFLMERHVPYDLVSRQLREQAGRAPVTIPGLRFALDDRMIEALVFAPERIRQAPVSPVDGRPYRRANTWELEQLLDAGAAIEART